MQTATDMNQDRFVLGDLCKYMIEWPAGAKRGDRMKVDLNIMKRATGLVTVLSNYSVNGIVF